MRNIKIFNRHIINTWVLFIVFSIAFLPKLSIAAATWTERTTGGHPAVNWSVAFDADGSHVIAAGYGDYVFTSSDGGASWTERHPEGILGFGLAWNAVASDADGSNLIAAVENGRIYTSSDSGVNWTERRPSGDNDYAWKAVGSDADGSTLMAAYGPGRLFTSSDGGANWTERQPAGNTDVAWLNTISDTSGNNLLVTGSRIYTSSDGGANWTERQPVGDSNENWQGAAMNNDGSIILAGIYGVRLYMSSNSGANWTEIQPAGAVSRQWKALALNDDGSFIIAGIHDGRIYSSSNGGTVWEQEFPKGNVNGYWWNADISTDGTNILISEGPGGTKIYTGVNDLTAPSTSTLSPADGATNVALDSNLVITFDEAVDVETGNITIKNSSDNSTVETIDVTSGNVTGTGTTTITINPTNDLNYDANYYINIDATAFDDAAGNSYAGIADATTWNFSTVSAPQSSSGSRASGKRPSVTVTKSEDPGTTVANSNVCKPGDLFSITTGRPCPGTTGTITTPGTVNTPNTGSNTCVLTLTLRMGSTGEQVKCLQEKLGITADGIFGPETEAAVMEFQKSKGLVVDGIVGVVTRGALQAQ